MTESPAWIVLAELLRPQGRKGEILAELLSDFPERFETHPRVFLAAPGFSGTESQARPIDVLAHWLPVGRNQGRIVLHFAGIDSISAAETLAGLQVIVPREERVPLDEDASYISDLVGCTVYDRGHPAGTVQDVQFATTPDGARKLDEAAPLLVLHSPQGGEILIPFARDFVVSVDIEARRIEMTLPEGLLDLNQ
jgi:16S rRNA processing protein RimM